MRPSPNDRERQRDPCSRPLSQSSDQGRKILHALASRESGVLSPEWEMLNSRVQSLVLAELRRYWRVVVPLQETGDGRIEGCRIVQVWPVTAVGHFYNSSIADFESWQIRQMTIGRTVHKQPGNRKAQESCQQIFAVGPIYD